VQLTAPLHEATPRTLSASLLAAAMSLPCVAVAQTPPERASVTLRMLDYLDSQPGAERVRVRAPALSVLAPVGERWSLGGMLMKDSISGASPAYHTRALSKLTDERHAGEASVTRYGANTTFTLGAQYSTEADYLSRGISGQATLSSADKNTTASFGLGLNRDTINPVTRAVVNERKRVVQAVLGLTQVLTPQDIVALNVGLVRGRGYFSDPYKVFDERPRERDQRTLMLRWNHHFAASDGSLRSSYRYYRDSFGVRAHTLNVEYVQPLAYGFSVMPLLRLYDQSAARFYVDADASTAPFPPNPPEGAVHFSEDQRLSAFGARTVGLRVIKQINSHWSVDLKAERYDQRGAWRVMGSGSPGLAPFRARSFQLGATYLF
jgi:Protein of unknown function (DUF3570)